jgi:hypothetical protein
MLKLLDYGEHNHFSDIIGKQRKLAWPVNAYRVTLPKVVNADESLNVFERVILKLFGGVGAMDTDELAAETRIPLDLVKSILLRLQDKGHIDEYNVIIRQEPDTSEAGTTPVFVTALLFRELATGKILPFLHLLDDTNPLQKKEGDEKDFRIIRGDADHKRNTPTQRDVINVLRAVKKRMAAFGDHTQMPAVQQITIISEPEFYYLDCSIAIQKGDGEFRIVDPFGNGFSLILENAFDQLLVRDDGWGKWLLSWKQQLKNSSSEKQDPELKKTFETATNLQRYPKLIANLKLARSQNFRSYAKIHASIEWAMFYCCSVRTYKEAVATFKLTAQAEHSALLAKEAKNIGLEPPLLGFRPIREGKLIDFENGKAELETVLAIAILQASNDDAHPLRHLSTSHTNFIDLLFDIKNKRAKKAHGEGEADAPEKELSDDSFMREIVHTLVPEVIFADSPVTVLDKNIRADCLLDARASIQGEFGFKAFNQLGANMQDRLIHAECFWLSCIDNDDALCFVVDLYAAIQAVFGTVLTGKLPPDIDDMTLIKTAEQKAVKAGLCKDFPDILRRVKPLAVRQTLQGSSQTLGACVIAFVLLYDCDTLHTTSELQSTFLQDIGQIIAKRGHGNEPLPLSKSDTAKLRKSAFTTIKTLMEL